MKTIISVFGLVLALTSFSQNYSNYYGTYDVNQKVSVNQNVNVSGIVNQNINKTVTTIDYGALAAANAQSEANRIAAMQFQESRDATRAMEIAADPFAAFKYGEKFYQEFTRSMSRKYLSAAGHEGERVTWSFVQPNSLLFNPTGFGKYRNTSSDGSILTEIEIWDIRNYKKFSTLNPNSFPSSILSSKDYGDHVFKDKIEGEVSKIRDVEVFTHKLQVGRATVYGHRGYVYTWIYETEFDFVIKDNYYALENGILYDCEIRYTVDKKRGSFEDLEGRRFYLRRLGEEVIATAIFQYF